MTQHYNQPGKEKGEDFDVRAIHGQLMREKSEPTELLHAAPAWLKHGFYAPLLIGGLIYVFGASGGFDWDEYNEGPRSTVSIAAANLVSDSTATGASNPPQKAFVDLDANLATEGKQVYEAVCMACHQSSGTGLPGTFPPLAGSDWVSGGEKRLAAIVLHGLMGPIKVNGETWNGVMPAQGATLDDRKIAAALSYVRSSWGNEFSPVSPEAVAEIRSSYEGHAPWTAQLLDAELP